MDAVVCIYLCLVKRLLIFIDDRSAPQRSYDQIYDLDGYHPVSLVCLLLYSEVFNSIRIDLKLRRLLLPLLLFCRHHPFRHLPNWREYDLLPGLSYAL